MYLSALASDAAGFASGCATPPVRTLLQPSIHTAVSRCMPRLANVELSLSLADNLQVMAPLQQIERALENVINNAADALCRERRRIAIRSRRVQRGGRRYACLEVEDTGAGMADVAQCLAPRVTTKREHSGLGLPIVQRIVEQECLGTLTIRSAPNQGTLVRMLFPLVTP